MTMVRRRMATLAVTVLSTGSFAVALPAPPASAATACAVYGADSRTVCVDVVPGQTQGQAVLPVFPGPTAPYIWLAECDGSGQWCNTMLGSVTQGVVTPWVATGAGHTYQACVDYYDSSSEHVFGCTAATT